MRLVVADDKRRLRDLEKEGLLRPHVSSTRPEWIVPPADHREPNLPRGYIVSFTKFHRHSLGSPPSCFMRVLCFNYGVELQHFSPNAITAIDTY